MKNRYNVIYNNKKYKVRNNTYKYYKYITETTSTTSSISNDANTLLLLHGEDFTDSSQYNRTITNNGATINSSGKFGNCFYTSGSLSSYLTTTSPISLGSGDFTIDFWINAVYNKTSWQGIVNSRGGTTTDYGWGFQNNSAGYMTFEYSTTGTAITSSTTATTFPTSNIWEHWAVVKTNNIINIYQNGVNVGSSSISGSIYTTTIFGVSLGITVDASSGSTINTGNYIAAYFDEFRISNVARWTSDFTPPTEPYTYTTTISKKVLTDANYLDYLNNDYDHYDKTEKRYITIKKV